MADTLQQWLLRELDLLLRPLVDAASSTWRREQLFAALGWALEAIPGLPLAQLDAILTDVATAYGAILELRDAQPETLNDLRSVLRAVDRIWTAIDQLHDLSHGVSMPQTADLERVGDELINFISTQYLRRHHPVVYELAALLTLIRARTVTEVVVAGTPPAAVRLPLVRPELRLERIVDLLRDPVGVLKAEYWPDSALDTAANAKQTAGHLFPHTGGLLAALGVQTAFDLKPDPSTGMDFGPLGNDLAEGMLAVSLPLPRDGDDPEITIGALVALSSADRGNLGVVIVPFGAIDVSRDVGVWHVDARLTGEITAFAIGPRGLLVLSPASVANVHMALKVARLPDEGELEAAGAEADSGGATSPALAGRPQPAFLVGGTKGTRLELGRVELQADLTADTTHAEFEVTLAVDRAVLAIDPSEGDGFLARVLPSHGLTAEGDLGIGWSSRTGFFLRGGAGLEITIPIHKSAFGVVSFDSLYFSIRAEGDCLLTVAATGSLKLGPLTASIDRIGAEAGLRFPQTHGNLGPLHLDHVAFKPPNGIGLAVDASVVSGGGFLFFDFERQEYAGVLQLELHDYLTLTAIGLLTTRMPDGSSGFSLLVIITAEGFTPIQLGWGFTLNGVGGLLGVNRTAAVEVLRSGLKAGTLDSVLFPVDPIRNAARIISDLRAVFPAAEHRYVFGPMAILGWGTPTVLTLELGIILEFPAPIRLIILGQLKALLPSAEREDLAIVRLKMDALGIVDFDRREVSLDATLYDSRLLEYVLSGDMALRARWGQDSTFVLAVGGFHPKFQPPPGFPSLNRIALSLTEGDNPRLRLDMYFALTSNTTQIGAAVELYAREGGFSIEGHLGFDALFHFDPFDFVADMSGHVTLRHGGHTLGGVQVDATITGPTPLQARGRATFKVLGVKQSVRFSARVGPGEPRPAPPPVQVRPLLIQTLSDRRNWSAQTPDSGHPLVSLRRVEAGDAVLVHPESGISVSQRLLPLNLDVTRFGNAPVTGDHRFAVTRAELASTPVLWTTVADAFAPAQFREMTDDQKLSAPGFERFDAGVSIGADALATGQGSDQEMLYDTIVVDPIQAPPATAGQPPAQGGYQVPPDRLATFARFGAAGRSRLARGGTARYAAPARPVTVAPRTFAVLDVEHLTRVVIDGRDQSAGMTHAAAVQLLATYLAGNPTSQGTLQVAGLFGAP